MHGNTPC
jgi:hypothetical protein